LLLWERKSAETGTIKGNIQWMVFLHKQFDRKKSDCVRKKTTTLSNNTCQMVAKLSTVSTPSTLISPLIMYAKYLNIFLINQKHNDWKIFVHIVQTN
jgi:hypothetical protein